MTPDPKPRSSILIVDDTVENLRLLVGILADRGYDARPVTNGAEALQAVAHDPPDLVLLDVTMPGMSGFEVCERLKASPTSRDIPVIFLTALTDVQDKVAGFTAGGVDFITKPFHVEEVVARVATQVALRRSREALAESLKRLQELESVRDDLVKMVVHDMRGLLMVVLAHLELARPSVSDEATSDIDAAVRAATAISRMSNTLLDVSRLEEGKMPIVPTSRDLASTARESRDAMLALDPSRKIEVIAAAPVMTKCDHELIRRVIDNLISNAIKHTPSGGRIEISVATGTGGARVAVKDEGAGVPPQIRGRMFEKFAGAHTGLGKPAHSAGLGLAFCKLAIEAHGGRIGVEDALPHGTILSFEIPL